MHAIQITRPENRTTRPVDGPFPWEEAHAAPEDRAVGIELELIELVRRRNDIRDATDPTALQLDASIDRLLGELGSLPPAFSAAG